MDNEYYRYCLENRFCAVCGKPNADLHHWEAVGMGRNRRKYDDSKHRKIALCRVHHTEIHQIGRDTFAEKYHVTGIEYNGKGE